MSRRLWIATSLLVLVQLGVYFVEYGYAPAAVTLPSYRVTDLPAQFEGWQSESVPTDFKIARATGADATQERVYFRPGEPRVSAHFGIWSDPDSRAPHLPQTCYAGGGWKKVAGETVQFGNPAEPPVAAALMTWERDGERVRTLHWYRRGDRTFFDWDGGCQVREDLWGSSNWPAVEKVLLQTADDNMSRDRLVGIALEIDRWMRSAR